MPTTFSYTALNKGGKSVSGTVPADTRAAAIAAIIGRGLSPLNIVEAGKNAKAAGKAGLVDAKGAPKKGRGVPMASTPVPPQEPPS